MTSHLTNHYLAVIEGGKPPSSASEASRVGIHRPHGFLALVSALLLLARLKRVVEDAHHASGVVQAWFETA